MTMTLVETIEVGSGGAASIEFTSIPQDADDLLLVVSSRASTTDGLQVLKMTFNSDSSSGSTRELLGTGSSAASRTDAYLRMGLVSDSANTSNTFASTEIYVPNYAGSTNKSVSANSVSENNATTAGQTIDAALWSNTSAITSIQLLMNAGNFVQYSTASLYKITKA